MKGQHKIIQYIKEVFEKINDDLINFIEEAKENKKSKSKIYQMMMQKTVNEIINKLFTFSNQIKKELDLWKKIEIVRGEREFYEICKFKYRLKKPQKKDNKSELQRKRLKEINLAPNEHFRYMRECPGEIELCYEIKIEKAEGYMDIVHQDPVWIVFTKNPGYLKNTIELNQKLIYQKMKAFLIGNK